jgi:hypothetical protein
MTVRKCRLVHHEYHIYYTKSRWCKRCFTYAFRRLQ